MFDREVIGLRLLAAAAGVEGTDPVCLGPMPGDMRASLRGFMYDDEVLKACGNTGPWKHKLSVFREDMMLLTRETALIQEYMEAREIADADRHPDVADEADGKAPRDEKHPATLAALGKIVVLWEAALSGTHTWLKYPSLYGPRAMRDEEFMALLCYRAGVHEAGRLLEKGQEFPCNCKADKKRGGVTLRSGLTGVPTNLVRCTGTGGAYVASHNAVVQKLHDAARDAKLVVRKEPGHWIDGQQAFGVGADGKPNKRPDLLIHLGREDAIEVDVSITIGTVMSHAAKAVRNPQAPLDHREKAKIGQYQRSSARKTNMSSVVPFVVSSFGQYRPSAGGLLVMIAKRAFGEDRCAAGRWLSRWRNRTIETLMRGASWQLIRQSKRLTKTASMSRSLRATEEA